MNTAKILVSKIPGLEEFLKKEGVPYELITGGQIVEIQYNPRFPTHNLFKLGMKFQEEQVKGIIEACDSVLEKYFYKDTVIEIPKKDVYNSMVALDDKVTRFKSQK